MYDYKMFSIIIRFNFKLNFPIVNLLSEKEILSAQLNKDSFLRVIEMKLCNVSLLNIVTSSKNFMQSNFMTHKVIVEEKVDSRIKFVILTRNFTIQKHRFITCSFIVNATIIYTIFKVIIIRLKSFWVV